MGFLPEFCRDYIRFISQRVEAFFLRSRWVISCLFSTGFIKHLISVVKFKNKRLESLPPHLPYKPIFLLSSKQILFQTFKNPSIPTMFGRPKIWPKPTRLLPQKAISIYFVKDIFATCKGQVFDLCGRTVGVLWHNPPIFFHKHILRLFFGVDTGLSSNKVLELKEVIVIQQLTNKTYGHFLIEIVPRMMMVREHCDENTPIYFTVDHPIYEHILSVLKIDKGRFISAKDHPVVRAKHAIVPKYTKRRGWIYSAEILKKAIKEIVDFSSESNISQGDFSERIFVKRPNLSTDSGNKVNRDNMLVNAEELEDELVRRGFTTVYPEQMSLAEQVQTFHHARIVIGEHGSGLFNSIFCKDDAIVFDIHAARPIEALFDILSMLEIKYVPIMNPEGSMIRWKKQKFNCSVKYVTEALDTFDVC